MDDYKNRIQHLKGTPLEIGLAMGTHLGPRLEANIDRYCRERLPAGQSFDRASWRANALPWLRKLPERFLYEFEGLSKGSGLSLQRIAEWASLDNFLEHRCSGAILNIQGRAWVIRNNDIFAPGLWGYVSIREVAGRIPSICFGMEGDVFTPTGINQEKLWLHYNYLPVWDTPVAGKPHLPGYIWLMEALETCRTLQDVEALLDRIQREDGMLLFAVDGKTNSFAIYECSCIESYKRTSAEGWLIGTNHYCTTHKIPPPDPAPLNTVSRYRCMESLVREGYPNMQHDFAVQKLIRILADDTIEMRSGEIITVYSNVACPGTGDIWYTFGGYPAASQGNWQKLDWPW